jgi:predicted nucleotidyltransferase
MSWSELLQARQGEHEALLHRAVELLRADPRVVAAWLFGSRGRDTADALSDTDVWVVVTDADSAAVVAERRECVARVARPVLVHEVLGNAPPHGAYLLVLYPGQAGPHQVDWYWQRESDASIPQRTVVLIERAVIPRDTRLDQLDPPSHTPQQRTDRVSFLVSHFWVMSNIAAKGTVRHFEPWSATSRIEALRGFLADVQRLVGVDAGLRGHEVWRTRLQPPKTASEQIDLLRITAHEMESLHPQIEAMGACVPVAVIPYVYEFFDLAVTMIEAKARTNYRPG